MLVATLDGKELTQALRQMKSTPGRKLGSAFWKFGGELEIVWSGGQRKVSAAVRQPLPHGILLKCEVMKHVAERLRYQGEVEVHFEGGHMSIGNDRMRADLAEGPRIFSLLVGSSAGDMLLASEVFSLDEAQRSGYEEEFCEVRARLYRSLCKAGKALDWTGISQAELNEAVLDHICAKAERIKGRFLVDD